MSNVRRKLATDANNAKQEFEAKCAGLEEAIRDKDEQLRAMDKLENNKISDTATVEFLHRHATAFREFCSKHSE